MHSRPDSRIGTMGFSYDDWAEAFYPKSLKSNEWLAFYAKHFNAVELDTTFHAVPRAEYVERWRDETPDDFRFTAKVPHAITHDQPLDRAGPAMREFLKVMNLFGEKLAVVLLQFPPSFDVEHFDRLRRFLDRLPREMRFAVELRDASWFNPRTAAMLRDLNIALVSADYVGEPRQLSVTADFVYIRWIGRHQQFNSMDHEQLDVTEHLQWWKQKIEPAASQVGAIYGFFNNDYSGFSITTANRFKRLMGLEVIEPADPRQLKLF